MAAKLKKLADQVVVITGASSGIGLATAEAAVPKGAKVVLAARSDLELGVIARRLGDGDGQVVAVACDAADRGQVELLPSFADKGAARKVSDQHYAEPPRHPEGILHQPSAATGVVGRTHGTGGRQPK